MVEHGVLLPTRGAVLNSRSEDELAARLRSEVVGLAERAESLGYRSVWVGDSVFAKPRPEPMTTLAAIGASTESVLLGTGVYLPTLRDPGHVAHMTATVDQLSGGRLVIGAGVGRGPAVRDEYGNLGVPFERRGRLLDETLDAVTGFWSGEEVDFAGEFVEYDGAAVGFGPLREPPIYLPYRSPDEPPEYPEYIERRFADHAAGWLPNRLSPDRYAEELAYIRGLLSDAGRDPDTLDPAFYHNVVIADTERAALDEARSFLTQYYPDYGELSDDDIRDMGAFGPPARVEAHLDAFVDAGVEHFVTRFTATNQYEQLDRFSTLIG